MSAVRVDGKAARESLQALAEGIYQAAVSTLDAGVEAAKRSAKSTTLFRDQTGQTRASIEGAVQIVGRRGLQGMVRAVGASGYLENGTRPHWIGSPVKIRGVGWRFIGEHPGTAERPFMAQAARAAEAVMDYAAEYYVNAAIARK